MLKTTGERLFAVLLGYVVLIILLLTLNPFYVALPDHIAFKFESSLDNLVQNVLLFLPIGFLYRLTTGRRGVLLLGAGLSFGIETIQLFIPARTPSIIDILANTLGAGLGGVFYDVIAGHIVIPSGALRRLRLETPLMGLIYLLVPLLWIDVLALQEAPNRWILTGLLGICGAIIFSDLFRHWWDSVKYQATGYASLASGVWFLTGVGPALLQSSSMWLLGLGVMLLTALVTILRPLIKDRRFERSTLKRLFPILGVYLWILTIGFPLSPFSAWHGFFGFTDRVTDSSLYSLYPRVEYLAAFTVVGYLIAEWRGRLELTLAEDLPRLFAIAAGIAVSFEFLSGFQSGRGASLVRLFLAIAGALFGGMIYHLSRAHIRFLLGR
jgi:VanZ family protein